MSQLLVPGIGLYVERSEAPEGYIAAMTKDEAGKMVAGNICRACDYRVDPNYDYGNHPCSSWRRKDQMSVVFKRLTPLTDDERKLQAL